MGIQSSPEKVRKQSRKTAPNTSRSWALKCSTDKEIELRCSTESKKEKKEKIRKEFDFLTTLHSVCMLTVYNNKWKVTEGERERATVSEWAEKSGKKDLQNECDGKLLNEIDILMSVSVSLHFDSHSLLLSPSALLSSSSSSSLMLAQTHTHCVVYV